MLKYFAVSVNFNILGMMLFLSLISAGTSKYLCGIIINSNNYYAAIIAYLQTELSLLHVVFMLISFIVIHSVFL